MRSIGVDLGGTKLLAGLVDEDGTILARERRVISRLPFDELLPVVSEAVNALGGTGEEPIGIGVPALLDREQRLSVRCVHLPLDGVPVWDVFEDLLGQPVIVDNDANHAVFAEWKLGAARGFSHAVMLTLGTGIGAGLILDGRPYTGAVGAASEIGHMPVDMNGPPCFGGCPGNGCLEALVSGSALARDAAAVAAALPGSRLAAEPRPLTGETVVALAREGDPDSRGILHRMGIKLGAGLAGVAMALNPELIVIGGGVMGAGDLLLEPARVELRRRAMAPSNEVFITAATLGEEAGMVGAALQARE